jgi:PAS domain S-box-containing protein
LATPEVFDELEKDGHVVSIGPPSIDWLGVPLRTKDRTIGVLGVQSYKEGVRYTEEDKNILTFVSEQVATTIERKQIEEALRESEARFRVLSEAAFEGIVVSDKGHILDANDQCAHIFGYKKSELIRKSVVDLVAPESRELVKKNIESGYEEPYEYQALRKDGTVISVEVTGKSIPYKGRLVRVTAIRDITDRKQAEEALRESKNLFSTFMDHLPAGAFIKDENSITQYVNKYMDDTFGAKEWVGKNTLELFPEKVAKRMNEEDRKALRKGMTVIEEQIPDKNGNIHTYQTFKFPILRKDKPGLLGGIGFDITKHKKAEQREKHLQEYLQLQIDRMPIALIVWDSDFRVQTWNPAAEKIFGFTVEETRGKHPYGLIVPKQAQPHVDNIWRRLLEGDATAHSTNENITKEGATIICDWSNTPLKRADGSVIGVLSMVQDITERKQAEEQIKASLREKEVLLQEIHHRVKNNMQIISSLIKLQSRHLKNGHMLELFKSTQNRVQSMAAIHERLYQSKDFTRINFNEYVQKLTVHLFSIYGISKEAVRLNTNIKDVSLDINTAIPCGLIINELVSNSLKHAFLNGKKGEIKIAMQLLNGNEIELIVSDNGIGLPKEVNFRKTESLGLHLVTILAEDQLHGDIELDRTAGTRFRMRFRLSEK